jgi:hypothetical protein
MAWPTAQLQLYVDVRWLGLQKREQQRYQLAAPHMGCIGSHENAELRVRAVPKGCIRERLRIGSVAGLAEVGQQTGFWSATVRTRRANAGTFIVYQKETSQEADLSIAEPTTLQQRTISGSDAAYETNPAISSAQQAQ